MQLIILFLILFLILGFLPAMIQWASKSLIRFIVILSIICGLYFLLSTEWFQNTMYKAIDTVAFEQMYMKEEEPINPEDQIAIKTNVTSERTIYHYGEFVSISFQFTNETEPLINQHFVTHVKNETKTLKLLGKTDETGSYELRFPSKMLPIGISEVEVKFRDETYRAEMEPFSIEVQE